jgi:hypothetical protein
VPGADRRRAPHLGRTGSDLRRGIISDPDTLAASNAAASGFHVYLGTDTQAADARMQATLGVANTPAWRGLAYLVFYDLALERYANSLAGAQVKVELVEQGVVGGPADVSFFSLPSLTSHSGPLWDGVDWYGVILINTSTARMVTSPDMVSWTQIATMPARSWSRILYHQGSVHRQRADDAWVLWRRRRDLERQGELGGSLEWVIRPLDFEMDRSWQRRRFVH